MTQKFHDFTYHAFSYDTEMIVVCPIAKQASNVQYDPIQKSAYFKCNGCYTHKKILPDADHSKISETKPWDVVAAKPQHEEDPYFHYPLYNQTNFRGNIVWA